MSVTAYVMFLSSQLGLHPNDIRLERGSPTEVSGLLQRFMAPLQHPAVADYISAAPYDPEGEATFDDMLLRLAADPESVFKNDGNASLTVWAERLKQSLIVLTANELAGAPVLVPPQDLDRPLREVAAALLWLHEMDLPYFPGTVVPK